MCPDLGHELCPPLGSTRMTLQTSFVSSNEVLTARALEGDPLIPGERSAECLALHARESIPKPREGGIQVLQKARNALNLPCCSGTLSRLGQ